MFNLFMSLIAYIIAAVIICLELIARFAIILMIILCAIFLAHAWGIL